MAVRTGIRIRVEGRVQGVGFRFFTQRKAEAYDLKGNVRNMPDGTVEVVAVGPVSILEGFIEDLREGPSGSRVRECRVEWFENQETFTGFSIRY